MRQILNQVRLQVQRALANFTPGRIGTVTNFDPNTMTARVALQPDGDMTGWLNVSSAWIGNGWGMFAPPNIGDLVKVAFVDGNINGGSIVARYYNQQNQPLPAPAGEFWLVHKLGAFFKLLNTGALTITDGQGATITLNGDGTITSAASNWTHTGNVTIDGNLAVSTGAAGTFTTPTGDVVTVQDGITTNID